MNFDELEALPAGTVLVGQDEDGDHVAAVKQDRLYLSGGKSDEGSLWHVTWHEQDVSSVCLAGAESWDVDWRVVPPA